MSEMIINEIGQESPSFSKESVKNRLQMERIVKEFPGVRALDHVNFAVRPGEIMGLVGENGAGKSTLMKVLSGAYQQDSGSIFIDEKETRIRSPKDALEMGIRVIYQEVELVPDLSVKENIFLGHMPTRLGLLDERQMRRKTQQIFNEIKFDIDPDVQLSNLSLANQHIVAIGQALSNNVQILVLDEPSSVIPEKDMGPLYDLLRNLTRKGIAIVYISHRLEEVLNISNRITILKDGALVKVVETSEVDEQSLATMLVGRKLEEYYPNRSPKIGNIILEIERLSTKESKTHNITDINLTLHKGEILGIYGLVGSGRTELAKTIFGVLPKASGRISIEGQNVSINTPQQAISLGLGLLVEDRKDEGLVLDSNVMVNITMANYPGISRFGWILNNQEKQIAHEYVDKLRIKTPLLETITRSLSGGNQQKLVLSKWLFRNAKILIFDEPTRGIDVGSKSEIYRLMNDLVLNNVAIIMISSEINEILGMADRILVMRNGRIADEVAGTEANEEKLVSIAMGV